MDGNFRPDTKASVEVFQKSGCVTIDGGRRPNLVRLPPRRGRHPGVGGRPGVRDWLAQHVAKPVNTTLASVQAAVAAQSRPKSLSEIILFPDRAFEP
jgi:hypothetical protein